MLAPRFLGPQFLVKYTILACLGDLRFGDFGVTIEVGASACHAQNAIIGTRGEVLGVERQVQELPG